MTSRGDKQMKAQRLSRMDKPERPIKLRHGNPNGVAPPIGIRLLRAEEVAVMLGCSHWYVYALAQRKDLPSIRIGRAVRFEYKAVEEFIDQRRPGKEIASGDSETG